MSNGLGDLDLGTKDRFINEFLPEVTYYRHSDIDLYVNLTITQILNFKTLLTDELNLFIQEHYSSNYNYYEDLKEEKEKLLKQYFSQNIRINDNKAKFKDSLLSYDFPEFEIYFIAKLFVDGMKKFLKTVLFFILAMLLLEILNVLIIFLNVLMVPFIL